MKNIRQTARVFLVSAQAVLAGCATTAVEKPYVASADYSVYRLPYNQLGCFLKDGADYNECVVEKARVEGKALATAWCARDGKEAVEREARIVTQTLPRHISGVGGGTVINETTSSVNYFFHCRQQSTKT